VAQAFTVIAQNRTVLVRSPTLVVDVVEIHAVTRPHGVTFVRAIPVATWQHGGVAAALEPIAEHIEHIMAVRPVVSAGSVQRVNASGLVQNYVEFVVHARDSVGPNAVQQQGTVLIPVQALHDQPDFEAYFKPVLDALDAAATA
jgi:hypothetical protein